MLYLGSGLGLTVRYSASRAEHAVPGVGVGVNSAVQCEQGRVAIKS